MITNSLCYDYAQEKLVALRESMLLAPSWEVFDLHAGCATFTTAALLLLGKPLECVIAQIKQL